MEQVIFDNPCPTGTPLLYPPTTPSTTRIGTLHPDGHHTQLPGPTPRPAVPDSPPTRPQLTHSEDSHPAQRPQRSIHGPTPATSNPPKPPRISPRKPHLTSTNDFARHPGLQLEPASLPRVAAEAPAVAFALLLLLVSASPHCRASFHWQLLPVPRAPLRTVSQPVLSTSSQCSWRPMASAPGR